ncbi:MAG: M23 family metallopeptidase, partial [Anaerolineaceae bacterium]|nr:M23 family metallopeptidase [Anaerolineaceae bacterium]
MIENQMPSQTVMTSDGVKEITVEELPNKRSWGDIWESLLRAGLGEVAIRIGTGLASVVMVVLVIWVMRNYYLKGDIITSKRAVIAAPLPTATPVMDQTSNSVPAAGGEVSGITRQAQLHTQLPARPRYDVVVHTVQTGDTIFGIAERFNLKPETILWGNFYLLADDPHRLRPGQELFILPVDGLIYKWHSGDGLNRVAEFYGVSPEDIIGWQGNKLDPITLGDWALPNIEPGTMLVVPGGKREFVTWSAPRITRTNPAVAKTYGPGACGAIMDGPIGSGTFIWPSVEKYLSGFNYSPEANHWGIDIAGKTGYAIFAADSGVVVYSGWNDWGYGNVIVLDHGNGWQTLYSHLEYTNVGCGAYVYTGDIIAGMGSTGNSSGPHLHFEMR